MIYNMTPSALDLTSTQFRLHVSPPSREMTAEARLYQVPLPARNPGGHLAYLVDSWVFDPAVRRLQTHDDLATHLIESLMQKRLPGLD